MSNIKLIFGTQSFLTTYLNQNSLFAHNVQHPNDYLLIQKNVEPTQKNVWQTVFPQAKLTVAQQFYLAFMQLSTDNRALLINQACKLPSRSILYQQFEQPELLIITSNPQILQTVGQLLSISVKQLNASLTGYLQV